MGLSMTLYVVLAITGGTLRWTRQGVKSCPSWLRPVHYGLGSLLVVLVLVLFAIGIIGTLGEYGDLGHSIHLPVGILAVTLTLASAWSATQISAGKPWARTLHLSLNGVLFLGFLAVGLTGWNVVQKYLP